MSSLADQLQGLIACGFSSDESSLYEAEKQVKDIQQSCLTRLTKQELGFYCSLLFAKDNGILQVLTKNVAKPQHKSVREEILYLLSTFVPRIGSFVRAYADDIYGCCVTVFRSDRYAKNKIKALQIIGELISKRDIGCTLKEDQINNLVKILFEEAASTRCTSTVKGESFRMLGTISEFYPEFMTNYSERLFEIFLKGLQKEMVLSTKASDHKLIEGYLLGLNALMFQFTASYSEDRARCEEILKFARFSLQPQTELTRFAVPLAGMKLLKNHATQFGPLLVDSYEVFYNTLYSWFEHKNPQVKHLAHAALDSFFQQIAGRIAEEDEPNNASKQLFMFFIRKFKSMMNSSDTSSKLMSLAVRGYGLLAGACCLYLSKSDVRQMFTEVMGRCEDMFLSGENNLDDNKIHQLPSFIQSLASIVKQLEISGDDSGSGPSESFLSSLCRLCVLMMGKYPRLHRKYYFFCHSCILAAVNAFDGRPDVRDSFLQRITYQGLIRSCSYGVVLGDDRGKINQADNPLLPSSGGLEDDIMDDIVNDARTITYRDYIPLWSSLMTENKWKESTDFVDRNQFFEKRRELCQSFTSMFLKSVLQIAWKLNLSANTTQDEDTITVTANMESLQAENAVDFKIFINLVDLCWDLLPSVMLIGTPTAEAFSLHFQTCLQQLVTLSTRFPHVSGFYKLLASVVKISCTLNYFSVTCSTLNESQDSFVESMELSEDDRTLDRFAAERQQSLMLLQKFAIEVVSRQKQYKDDLLASSLFFLLSLPSNVASGILEQLTPAVQRAAVLGISYFPLAEALLSALERWKDDYLKNQTSLEAIIVALQPFLTPDQGQDFVIKDTLKIKKKSKSSIQKQKNIKAAEEPARKKIRSRVVRYLGSLGGRCLSFLKTPDDSQEEVVAPWDKDIIIKYAIPFRDLKPEIRLDLYLPRVLEVASRSSDRHAKISACELLHSIVLYLIGTNAQTMNMKSVTNLMPSLYKKLFPVLLNLACDVDRVCKQMFEPLMKQIIHWFTNNRQFESPSTVALLDSIMDGVVDSENASLRELSAQFLCEFLAWSIKQNTSSTTSSPTNAKSIFKRIYSLARHPSAGKRLGASVAFNYIYRVFREQDAMVDDYLLEILVTFIDSLALAHEDDPYIGTEASCVQSLKHIDRIVKAKSKNLNKASKSRRTPKGFDPNKLVTLTSVVEWLFDQCGRPQTECRHQCMKFFYDFVKLIPDDKLRSATLWMNDKKQKEGSAYFTLKFENGNGNNGIQSYVYLSSMSGKFSVKTGCNWFDLVLAPLEAYSWVFQEKLMTPSDLFPDNNQSCLFRSLRYFICDVAPKSLKEIASKFSKTRREDQVFTPRDIELYNRKKCSLISRIIQFFTMLFQRFPDQALKVIPDDFWSEGCILSLVTSTVISSSSLGFDTLNDDGVVDNLRQISNKIIALFLRYLPSEPKRLLLQITAKKLSESGSLSESLPPPFGDSNYDPTTLRDVINAYVILHECKMLEEISKSGIECPDFKEMGRKIFDSVFNSVVSKGDDLETNHVTLTPQQILIGSKLLELSLKLGCDDEVLVDRIYNNTQLVSYDRRSKMRNTNGQIFASTFSTKICEEICCDPLKYVPSIIDRCCTNLTTCTTLVTSLLEYLATHKAARKKYSSDVCSSIVDRWQKLKIFWHEDSSMVDETSQSNVLDILRKIFALDARVCSETNHPSLEAVFEMYSYMLSSAKLKLSVKLEALDLLSFFTLAETHADRLKSSIESLVARHFPLSSKEFSVGSTSYNQYTSAVRKLLSCLEMTGNIEVFQIVVNIFCREEDHVLSDEMRETFMNCVKRIPVPRQKVALDVAFSTFDQSRSSASRCHTVHDIIVPMATQCDVISLVEFFASHVVDIMAIVKEDTKRYPETQWIDQLERKSLSYRLLELMFSLLPKEQIDVNSTIGQAYNKGESKESVMKSFMTKATRDRNENLEGESQLLEERRKFHCSVYNAMIAAVICTQTDQKWYKAFLFDENPSKNQFLLNNVIPCKEKYKFEVESSEPLVKRKRFVAIRKTKQDHDESGKFEMFAPYMSSVAGSSLSEEVSAFDGNRGRTIQISSTQSQSDAFGSTSSPGTSTQRNPGFQGNFIELESNSLNQHECMASMVGLITHMHHNNIGFPSGDNPSGECPAWMSSLIRKFSSSSSHPNVRLFIAKLVVNCEAFFRPFAKHLIPPLIRTVTLGDCGSDGIDWMTCDIVATAISWNNVAIPEDSVEGSGLVQGLLEHLAEKFSTDNRSLLRHNLDLIKATVECWGSRAKSGINPKIVYDLCASTDPESKSNFAALQLLGSLLANGVSPYTQSYIVDRTDFFKRIFNNMVYKRKEIYDSAAEVAGMTLKYLTQVRKESEGEIHEMVANKLLLLAKDPKRQDVFITSLHKVASHHPPIVDQFLSRVMYLVSKVHGDLLTYCLEIIHKRADSIQDLFAQLKAKNFASKLGIGNEDLQLVCLRICYSIVSNNNSDISDDDVMLFFGEIAKHFTQHHSAICRQEALNVAMEIYDRQASLPVDKRSPEVDSAARLFLLKMLNDPEEVLRTQVANYWNKEDRLPVQVCSKLGSILSQLYHPGLDETKYLANTISLLLQSASLSPDFERPMFDHPLSECVFQEYTIDNRWRHRHSSMTPMFADTLQPTGGSGDSPQNLASPPGQPNLVMATQEQFQFAATMDVAGKNTYNWMTGSSLDTFSSLAVFAQPERKSSLMATSSASGGYYRPVYSTLKPGGPDFGKSKLVYSGKDEFGSRRGSGVDVDVERLRRRFRKENDESRMRFARNQERRKKMEEAAKKEVSKRRENEVQLHRKYRAGELPDVQIPHRSIVAPLAAACQHDPHLSRIVLSSLIISLLEEESKIGKKKSEDRVNNILSALVEILQRSLEKNPALIGCIQDVCYHDNRMMKLLAPDAIASAALASNNLTLGIMLLEEMILNAQDDEPSFKRRKIAFSTIQSSPDTWLQLARLYKSVGDFDVLRGIFGEGSGSNPATARGMSLEAQNCHKEARKIYEKALNDEETDASEVEKDLWEDCLLNSLKQMSRWDHVNQMCDSMLDRYDDDNTTSDVTNKLERAWLHPDYQERYLDSAVHAKLLMLLQGHVEVGNQLSSFFDDAMQSDVDKKSIVERRFPEHLAMLYLYKEDYNRAKYYLHMAAEHATQRWSSAGNFGHNGEQDITRLVSLLSDIHEFLEFAQTPDENITGGDMRRIVTSWMTRMPHLTYDPITSWHDVISYRSFLMDRMSTRIGMLMDDSSMEAGERRDSWMSGCRSTMLIEMMRSAFMNQNFVVADKIRKALEKEYETMKDEVKFKLSHATAGLYHAHGRHLAEKEKKNDVLYYLAAHRSLHEITPTTGSPESIHHHMLLAFTYLMTSQCVARGCVGEVRDDVVRMVGGDGENLEDSLLESSFHSYKQAVKESGNCCDDLKSEALNNLAMFCHKQLKSAEEGNDETSCDARKRAQYAVTMTTCVLQAMKINSCGLVSTATMRFPRLLQLLEMYGKDMKDVYHKEISSVPSWTFLPWLGHMVALLDSDVAPFLHPIVTQVSHDYPQAIVYPLCAAQEGFSYQRSDAGKKNKNYVKKLLSSLHQAIPLAKEFIRQLQQISDPAILFKDWFSNFTKLQKHKREKKVTNSELLVSYQNMYRELFDHDQLPDDVTDDESSSLFGSVTSQSYRAVGALRTKFAKDFKPEVDELFGGSAGNALLQMRDLKKVEPLCSKISKFCGKGKSLRDYSPWLADYQSLQRGDRNLEIPGQYHGRSRPLVEYHVTVVGFDERVQVMSSLRRPCRVIIRGSDEKDHSFLVKGGEDLRQDQRIEQLFVSINDIFKENPQCRDRGFNIITYQVIPINSKVGLIEWLPNVVPFLDLMAKRAAKMDCESVMSELSRSKWVPPNISNVARNRIEEYGLLMQKASYTDVVARFNQVQSKLPWNLLRDAYIRMSSDPESFLLLRKRFLSSYGVMCVVHWILGIGDRHPSNFMVSMTTGRAVGIDFGHAFGSATEVLPVPELVPFRMTRQIISLLLPHQIKRGEMRQVMVRCLSAVRSRMDEFLPLLDVFVKDPSVDWVNFAKKSRDTERSHTGDDVRNVTSDRAWYVRRKMKIVDRKLRGENPASITCDEIMHNADVSRYQKYYCSVARGDGAHGNVRAQLGNDDLSVEEQVDCLLDQATDPNLLGRCWQGWKSWL